MNWDRYQSKWTDLSFKEMINFSRWMNKIFGYHPTIIGGWAVYMYNSNGFGSRDIDVIIPTRDMRDRVITQYLTSNGYQIKDVAFGEKEWIKELEPGNPDSITYLDICTLEDGNPVHGRDLEVPWNIAMKWQRDIENNGIVFSIPSPEPLLVFKVKAAWDRNHDINITGGTPFLKDKVLKDRFDIISLLLNCKLDLDVLKEILVETRFRECFIDSILKAISEEAALRSHGLNENNISSLEGIAENIIESIIK